MSRLLRGLTLSTLLATTPLNAQEPEDTGLQSFADIPSLTMSTIGSTVEDGFSVVYVYGSTPKREAVLAIEWTNDSFYNAIISPEFPVVNFYKFDVQPLVSHFGSRANAQPYLDETFQAYGSPTLVFFCNGEIKRSISPFSPKLDQTDLSFSNPKNQVASKKLSDAVVKATIMYAPECK